MTELKSVVEACEHFVLIMDPWDAPICFSRVWCVCVTS